MSTTSEAPGTNAASHVWAAGVGDELGELGAGARQFIEGMGIYLESLGIRRIGGRILGLLMMAERPLTLDDMARALKVSRASISTNARMSVAVGMVDHVILPGDQRDYDAFSADAWTRRMQVALPQLDMLHQLAERGPTAFDNSNTPGRERLRAALAFCDFYRRETEASITRWQAHISARQTGARAPHDGGA